MRLLKLECQMFVLDRGGRGCKNASGAMSVLSVLFNFNDQPCWIKGLSTLPEIHYDWMCHQQQKDCVLRATMGWLVTDGTTSTRVATICNVDNLSMASHDAPISCCWVI